MRTLLMADKNSPQNSSETVSLSSYIDNYIQTENLKFKTNTRPSYAWLKGKLCKNCLLTFNPLFN